MNRELLEVYSDYLLSSFGYTTATGLSALTGGAISHDKAKRFLSGEDYGAKHLWQEMKLKVVDDQEKQAAYHR